MNAQYTGPLTDVEVKLSDQDGNAFFILGSVCKELRRAGHEDLVEEFWKEATSGDYDHLLQTCMKYVHVT